MICSGVYHSRNFSVNPNMSYICEYPKKECVIYAVSGICINVPNLEESAALYIGSTKDNRKRNYNHFSDLEDQEHANIHLQYAYNKYGEENFVYLVLEHCQPEERKIREQNWTDYYNSNFNYKVLYNISELVGGPDTQSWTEERRKEVSNRVNGENNPFYGKTHTKRTRKILSKPDPNSSQEDINLSIWDEERLNKFKEMNMGNKNPNFGKKKNEISLINQIESVRTYSSDDYVLISPNNEIVPIWNLSKFCRDNNLSRYAMRDVIYEERKQHKGWRKYKNVTN